MDDTVVQDLVDRAKASDKINSLAGMKATGASGFFQAFEYLASQHDESCSAICKMVLAYLRVTATHWNKRDYRKGVKIAGEVIDDLHAAS